MERDMKAVTPITVEWLTLMAAWKSTPIHRKHYFWKEKEALRSGDLSIALSKAKRSLQLDNDDIDAHCLYAGVMQAQLNAQTEKDPNLFNHCVEEWLSVMRNHSGEEDKMRVHGINPFGDLFHDEDRSIEAKAQLRKLTGAVPRTFETDNHYLKRVLRPSTSSVSAAVVSKKVPNVSTPN